MHADMAELGGQQPVKHFAVKARTGEILLKIIGDEDLLAPCITGAELAPRERGVSQVPALQGDGFEDGVGVWGATEQKTDIRASSEERRLRRQANHPSISWDFFQAGPARVNGRRRNRKYA